MNQKNIDIFNDTLSFIKENSFLSSSIIYSINNTKIYKENEYPLINNKGKKELTISISKNRTFEAAMKLQKVYPNKKIGVLNFASATNPGGGVIHGSSAQEECLCRTSTLFPVLNTKYLFDHYYQVNRNKKDNIHTDDVIYIPDIVICKSDTKNPIRLEEKVFLKVDVLSAAAPNLRENPNNIYNQDNNQRTILSDDELFNIHLNRAKHILHIASYHNIDVLVLGAFGCGAFRNNPTVVAKAYKEVIKEYKDQFDVIEFAIYCNEYDDSNYVAFKEVFE